MNKPTDEERLNSLHREMMNQFNDGALTNICSALGIQYNQVPGSGREDKTRWLLEYLNEQKQLHRLLNLLKQKRPVVNWGDLPSGQPASSPPAPSRSAPTNEEGSLLRNPTLIAAFVTAGVTLIVGLTSVYMNWRSTNRPIEATQTAEARLTIVSHISLSTIQANPVGTALDVASLSITETPNSTATPIINTQTPRATETNSALVPAVTIIGMTDTPAPTSIPVPESQTKTVYRRSAGTFFDEQLVISVYAISAESRTTTFGISAPGFPEEIHTDLSLMDRSSYTQNGVFEITVTGFDAFSDAPEFTVTRLQKPVQTVYDSQTIYICKNNSGTAFNKALILAVTKASWELDQISFEVFSPGKTTLRIENQEVGKKFTYQEIGTYEIQIMDLSSFGECVTFAVRRLP